MCSLLTHTHTHTHTHTANLIWKIQVINSHTGLHLWNIRHAQPTFLLQGWESLLCVIMKTMFGGIIKEVRGEIRKRQMKRVQGRVERKVEGDRGNGGGGENEAPRTEKGGERLPHLSVCRAIVSSPFSLLPSSLLPCSFFLCISMIKTWWNRAAGRSLDIETMLSPEQASTAGEQPLGDYTPTTHTRMHTQAHM